MKSFLITLALSVATTLPAHAILRGNEGANGGDDVGLQFQQSFSSALAIIKDKLPDLDKQIQQAQLVNVLAKAKVLVVDQDLSAQSGDIQQDSVAINIITPPQILINRARWNAVTNDQLKEAIALHEVASLAGLESTGTYTLSQQFLSMYHLSLDPQYDFTCDARIKLSEQMIDMTAAALRDNQATFIDAITANLAAPKVKYDCHRLSIDAYCAIIVPMAQDGVDLMQEEVGAGSASMYDLLQVQLKQAEATAVCKP